MENKYKNNIINDVFLNFTCTLNILLLFCIELKLFI